MGYFGEWDNVHNVPWKEGGIVQEDFSTLLDLILIGADVEIGCLYFMGEGLNMQLLREKLAPLQQVKPSYQLKLFRVSQIPRGYFLPYQLKRGKSGQHQRDCAFL